MTKAGRRKYEHDDEPELDLTELTEFGGELYFAVGETAGGAPYGLTLAEWLEVIEDSNRGRGWARAKRLLRRATTSPDSEPDVGRVVKIGKGLSRDVFAAEVTTADGSAHWVVLLPRKADPELGDRTRREARLLARLASIATPFRVPRPIAVLSTPIGPALVREHMDGMPVDLRAGRTPRVRPIALVGQLAAAVHAVPIDALGELDGHATRRAHGDAALAGVSELERDSHRLVRSALAWLRDNLPPDEPASLLHGDLLGQNILLPVPGLGDPDTPPALIDWEYATRGDPAYDLAIVTRGVRKPFQLPDGFERLLGAYRESSSRDLEAREIRFHELCMVLRWYRDQPSPSVRQQHLRVIENVLASARSGC